MSSGQNEIAGRINGQSLHARAPPLTEPAPGSLEHVVIKCYAEHINKRYAEHINRRAKRRSADQFRQLRTATHLYLGALGMLTVNRI